MPIKVYVYDASMRPLPNRSIEILENDKAGVRIDSKFNRPVRGGLHGAWLKDPFPLRPFIIWLDDHSKAFAPADLGFLNGSKLPAELHICLYPLPKPSGGGGNGDDDDEYNPGSDDGGNGLYSKKIQTFIQKKIATKKWKKREGQGVISLIEGISRALYLQFSSEEWEERLQRWIRTLQELGININPDNLNGLLPEKGPRTPFPVVG